SAAWRSAVALSLEAFRANLSPLDSRVLEARPAAGQVEFGSQLRSLMAGSALFEEGAARRVQDPLSFRVVAQVHGSLQTALANAVEQIEVELNSAAESPLVVTGDDVMLSNGNFHVPALALAFDTAAIAFAQASSLAAQRVIRFMSPAFTDLPLQLTRHGPAHSGFATIQKTLTALWSEIRLRANPGSLDFLPVSEGVEDHATMALGSVEKLDEMVERIRYVVAIELLVASQAIDLRELDMHALGAGAGAAYARVREIVPMLDADRPLGPDVDAIAARVAAGAFAAIALPVGIVAARRERVYAVAITVSGFLYTIPTLAFLALLIPLVGLGRTNAIVAMVAFSLVVLIRNVATGIRGVSPDVVDAARGMGMSARQLLLRIELP